MQIPHLPGSVHALLWGARGLVGGAEQGADFSEPITLAVDVTRRPRISLRVEFIRNFALRAGRATGRKPRPSVYLCVKAGGDYCEQH